MCGTGKTVARVSLVGLGTPRGVEAISLGPDHRIHAGDFGGDLGGT
ncbi:hypothetical protein [Streptomyces hirsutus]